MKTPILAFVLTFIAGATVAAPVTYNIDPNHTYPSFAADHMGGLSVWRGKFRSSSGTVILDSAAHEGEVNITIDTASIDFGHAKLNENAKTAELFDVAKFPTATYKGKLANFENEAPTAVIGELTLHGVTKPVNLTIHSFKCMLIPKTKKQTCGADASATINRADFGIDIGKAYGFNMAVELAIQVEAIKAD